MEYENELMRILYNSMKYPGFCKWFDSLPRYEQREFVTEIETVLQNEFDDGYEDAESEIENANDDAYDSGFNNAIAKAIKVFTSFSDEPDIVETFSAMMYKDNEN